MLSEQQKRQGWLSHTNLSIVCPTLDAQEMAIWSATRRPARTRSSEAVGCPRMSARRSRRDRGDAIGQDARERRRAYGGHH